ncbi:Ribosome-binding ATPase YchF [Pelotomaculum propionicicum]|uniref:Ribosome-binding ATPase YchF n=1 Tax=Pelotomaculum propionicicum TaxID=258475 RepID=A0A4Y7RP24_9FIRM|nr:Ribosome-binding ATPase YchF [Pelotomaculum propionicicum]
MITVNLNCGLIGLPMVGKTTIFNLLTGAGAETSNFLTGKTETNIRSAVVPDHRVDFLSGLYKPRKTTYAQIQFSDVPGLVRGSSQGQGVGNQFLNNIRNVDLLVHVVRAFANGEVPHVDGSVNPMRDIETINLELLFADMEVVEKKIERIKSGKKIKKENAAEIEIMEKCLSALENETPIGSLEWSEAEKFILRNYSFLTEKPMLLVVNTDEEQFKSKVYEGKSELQAFAAGRSLPELEICGKIEAEISQLPDEDKEMFLADLGISQSGIDRLARAAYDYLGLISFFTVGEDEVKAWTIQSGTEAKQAAGKIHSDIERGFIKAEVVKYRDLETLGSMAKVKEKGLFRLEGKDYRVEDGDIIHFRFNV